MYCSKCGAPINGDTIFCPKCGTRTDESNETNAKSNEFDDTMVLRPISASDSRVNSAKKPNVNKYPQNIEKRKSDNNNGSNNQKTIIVLLSVCIALMLILIVIFAFKLSGTKNDEPSDDKTVVTETKKNEAEKKIESEKDKSDEDTDENSEEDDEPKKPISYSTIPVDMVYASSEREEDDTAFSASFAADSKLSTAWSPNSDGLGESITLCFESSRKVHGMKIANGYSRSSEDYSQNSRVKNITVKFPDGNIYTVELSDGVVSMQTVDFGREIQCSSMTVIIDSVYDDTLPVFISEIEVF